MRRIYNNVDDIDLFVGMLSERPQTDSILGVTALCIIGRFLLLFNYVYLGRYWKNLNALYYLYITSCQYSSASSYCQILAVLHSSPWALITELPPNVLNCLFLLLMPFFMVTSVEFSYFELLERMLIYLLYMIFIALAQFIKYF